MDDLRKKSDKELEKMEKKLVKIYKDAEKDITKSWNEYMKKAENRIAKYEEKYEKAKKSGDQDLIAKTGKTLGIEKQKVTLKDTRYKEILAQTTEKLTHTNEIALAYVNDQMPKIYTLNYNGTLQEIQSEVGKVGDIGFSFSLVDERTVRNLAKSDTSLFPQKTIDRAKDEKWNLKAINSQVLQGILQGESIPKIADRLQNVTDMNSKAAVRNARTMCTAAENNGRLSGMKEAEEQGIVYEKQWMATHDDRTRVSHAEIDGVSVGLDEEFPNGLQYPGDPMGYPEEIYNCFVGETKVGANSRIIRTYKHKYSGQLFTVKTASGIQFTCTPNHPILTSRGWIAANRINDGDDLFVTSVSKKPFFVTWSNPYINHVLARFDTIHKFFKVLGRKRTADLGVNFHGDIPTSEVEIVTQKRFLRNNRNTCGGKSVNKFFFVFANKAAFCKSTFMEHFSRIWQSSFCGIGSKGEPFSLFGRCLRHSKIHSLRPIALLDSGRIQQSYNNGARYAQLLSNSLNGFSGIVFADKVISIDIKFSHCDVFNLQSENGYYFARSIIPQRHRKGNNDIMVIAHNCRCSMVRELIGFRRADGSISHVEGIVDYEPDYFQDTEKKSEPVKVEQLSEELQKTIKDYTDGEYEHICAYSQYLVNEDADISPSLFASSKEWWEKEMLPNISEKERQEAEELSDIIKNQPITNEKLWRIEREINKGEEGDCLKFGIKSTSASDDFVEKTTKGETSGFTNTDYLEKNNDGGFTEYRFLTSKCLDISPVSVYPEQNERLIFGEYKIVKTEMIKPVIGGSHWKTYQIKDVAENIEYFTSKSGKEMVRYTYDGTQKTDTLEKFSSRTVEEYEYTEGVWGRKIIYLEAIR